MAIAIAADPIHRVWSVWQTCGRSLLGWLANRYLRVILKYTRSTVGLSDMPSMYMRDLPGFHPENGPQSTLSV